MTTKLKVATPPYPRLGEIYNALAQAFDTKSKNRDVERLAREGDFDWFLLSGLREDLILAPLRRYVEDEAFIDKLDKFIQHVHASYLRIVSSISLDSMSRNEALPILIKHYFAHHAIGFFESIWTREAPSAVAFLNPENYSLEVVLNWADPRGSHFLAKAAFPETSDVALDNREKVTRWADGTQLPDVTSLKLFVDSLAKNGSDEHKAKAPGILKWLVLARALTWFERKANPIHLKQTLIWHASQGNREWDIGKTLSMAAINFGKKREALLEPFGKLMCCLSRTEPKADGVRIEAENALADFAQQLRTHDPEGLVYYALEWFRGRWHVLSGEYEEALKSYQLAGGVGRIG